MRLSAMIIVIFLANPHFSVAAEWWEGTFSPYHPEAQSELYGKQCVAWQHDAPTDDYPLIISTEGTSGYEWGCEVEKRTNILTLDAIIFDLDCGSEGIEYTTRAILMRTDDPSGLAIYPGRQVAYGNPEPTNQEIVQLYLCPKP